MSNFFTARDGEIIDLKTGEVVGRGDKYFIDLPPLSKDANSLLRNFDGMSAEPLGNVPKIIALSNDELSLLRKLRPWDMLKYEFNQDYRKLITKINAHKISLHTSIRFKNLWKDPDYRAKMLNIWTPFQRLNASLRFKERWSDPDSMLNSKDHRDFLSKNMIAIRGNPLSIYNTEGYKLKRARAISDGTKKRFSNLRNRARHAKSCRQGHAWLKSGAALSMLFDSP